ncbi:TonB-dependent receptor plug domain-containing protein [Stutzerimonas kunmingensis]|uniref:TonB-dependent receptor plug domain-containing protein n=1 Tax=Stutzerimonas kunmingensis TaxID=1211807 RepID=UPI0028AFE4D9|nr:TonB-dependent receptor plug domain-containing protein [Stutzerimonas kunmingensis]
MSPRVPAHRHQSVFQSLFGAVVLAGLLAHGPAAADTTPALQQQARHYDIPSQPLSAALIDFGQQANMQVSADSRLLSDKYSGAVQGTLTLELALQRLLGGTGLIWHLSPNGALNLEPEPSRAAPSERPMQFDDVVVLAEHQRKQGDTVIDRRTIEALPSGNGDITSLLRTHPNVQFDDSQLSSKTPGEIDPADISINGAKYWQNLYLVDGISMNNDIDPVADNPVSMTDVPGRSQGMALDTDLLEEIRILDSNVPAAFGGFNGGVVEAITRKPRKELQGKVSLQMARSEWTEYHIDETQEEDFQNSSSAASQPEFDKLITRGTLEGHLTDNFGLLANFSRKTSTIPLKGYNGNYSTPEEGMDKEQKRQIDNYFVKASWQVNDALEMNLSLTHAPQVNEYFIVNARDSATRIQSGGDMLNWRIDWEGTLAKVSNTLFWNRLENSRDSEKDYYKGWYWSEATNWSSSTPTTRLSAEGSYGDIEQQQTTYGYKLNADWTAFRLLSLDHRIQSGLELSQQNTYYERLEQFQYGSLLRATSSCIESDWCSMGYTPNFSSPGQAFTRLNTYEAGKIEFDTRAWALYLQDEMKVGRLTLRPGLRLDGDDYMEQKTLAPRFAMELDVFGNGHTRIIAGANRYYGRNMSAYRLYDGRAALQTTQTRANGSKEWSAPTRTANASKFSQLDIPYDDELTLGLEQIWWDTRFAFKYVNRKGRDQIIRTQGRYLDQPTSNPSELSTSYYTYANLGSSETDVYTLSIAPLQDLELLGTLTHAELAVDWTDVTSSHEDYSTAVSEALLEDPLIQYDGAIMRYSERPADNFNRPWTVRLTTITDIPQLNLSWSNFLRYRDGYRRITDTGQNTLYNGAPIDIWAEQAFAAALVWDTRLAWEQPTGGSQAIFVNLDVSNLLDEVVVSSVTSSGVPTYEIGRQFMVEVGYRF